MLTKSSLAVNSAHIGRQCAICPGQIDGANAELTDLAVRLGFLEALLAAPPDDASRAIVAQLIEQGRQAQREQVARRVS